MSEPERYPRVPDAFIEEIDVRLFWCKKHNEKLVGEEKLEFMTLHDLQDIFDVYIDNAALNFWHVKTRHARVLQQLIKHRIKINRYLYFVEQKPCQGYSD